jgi:hypothetical protein
VEKYLFLALDFINREDKSAWENGKRPSRKRPLGNDCIGCLDNKLKY